MLLAQCLECTKKGWGSDYNSRNWVVKHKNAGIGKRLRGVYSHLPVTLLCRLDRRRRGSNPAGRLSLKQGHGSELLECFFQGSNPVQFWSA